MKVLVLTLYIATILATNWMVERFGFIGVGFGLVAPAGVYAAGVSFTLRDWLHELAGRWWVIAAIVAGAALSWAISPAFAVASGVAFLASEFADLAIYSPLRERQRYVALVLSNAVGSVVDSMVFLWLAFGSIQFWEGQVIGKMWTVILAIVLLWLWRHHLSKRVAASPVAA